MENGDLHGDPLQFMRATRASVLLDPDAKPRNIGLPVHPGDAGYKSRIPPPEPLDSNDDLAARLVLPAGVQPDSALPNTGALPSPLAQQRVVISFGPKEGTVIVAIESGVDWDVEDDASWAVSWETARVIVPILKKLTKVKDMTGRAYEVQHESA